MKPLPEEKKKKIILKLPNKITVVFSTNKNLNKNCYKDSLILEKKKLHLNKKVRKLIITAILYSSVQSNN